MAQRYFNEWEGVYLNSSRIYLIVQLVIDLLNVTTLYLNYREILFL